MGARKQTEGTCLVGEKFSDVLIEGRPSGVVDMVCVGGLLKLDV